MNFWCGQHNMYGFVPCFPPMKSGLKCTLTELKPRIEHIWPLFIFGTLQTCNIIVQTIKIKQVNRVKNVKHQCLVTMKISSSSTIHNYKQSNTKAWLKPKKNPAITALIFETCEVFLSWSGPTIQMAAGERRWCRMIRNHPSLKQWYYMVSIWLMMITDG